VGFSDMEKIVSFCLVAAAFFRRRSRRFTVEILVDGYPIRVYPRRRLPRPRFLSRLKHRTLQPKVSAFVLLRSRRQPIWLVALAEADAGTADYAAPALSVLSVFWLRALQRASRNSST
jgi:hypothetical protein